MARFKNNTGHDVYMDFGKFTLVRPNEIINLEGTFSAPPLTLVEDFKSAPKFKPKKTRKKPTSKGTSGTI